MDLSSYREQIRNWFDHVDLPQKKAQTPMELEVEGISYSYVQGHPVLENINFGIHKGEMVSIVGKNGAGKSTLSSLICGFMESDEGVIRLAGEDISGWSVKERGEKIGLVMPYMDMIMWAFI